MERIVERHLKRRVEALGGAAMKFVSPGRSGVSDRIVVLPGGEIWFVELKQKGGRLTVLQQHFAEMIQSLGANYICLWSKEEVDTWISKRNSLALNGQS